MSQDAQPEPVGFEAADRPSRPTTDERIRLYLSLVVAVLVAVLALAAVVQPSAGAVLDKILPLLTLVLGYFFGQQVQRGRS